MDVNTNDEATPVVVTLAEAQAQLTEAEANLEKVERPFWDLEHAKIDLNQATNIVATVPGYLKEAAEAEIPKAQAKLEAAQAAFDKHEYTTKDVDIAAQAVVDARVLVEELTHPQPSVGETTQVTPEPAQEVQPQPQAVA